MNKLLIFLAAALTACGGGGGDAPGEDAPWETSAGVCSFDSTEAHTRGLELGAVCQVVLIGNTLNGQKCPAKSWPSDGVVTGSVCPMFQNSGSAQDAPAGDAEDEGEEE